MEGEKIMASSTPDDNLDTIAHLETELEKERENTDYFRSELEEAQYQLNAAIATAVVCEAVNTLPKDVRRLVAHALRERLPIYPWTMSHDGRLECRE
jgi:hypothetical protein